MNRTITKLLAACITSVYILVFVAYIVASFNLNNNSSWLIFAVCMIGHIGFLASGLILQRLVSFMPKPYPDTRFIALYYLCDLLQALGGGFAAYKYHNTLSYIDDKKKSQGTIVNSNLDYPLKIALLILGFVASMVCFHRSYYFHTHVV